MSPEEEDEVEVCGQFAYAKFRRQAQGLMTSCCLEPYHAGNHVYCLKIKQGIDHRSHALEYFEEINRGELKPLLHLDMQGQALETDNECAALYQFLQELERVRKQRKGNGK